MSKPRPPVAQAAKKAAVPLAYPALGRGRLAERLRPDAKQARQVQRSFLPARLPQVPGYQFYAYYEPAQDVGGDYYDFIPVPPAQRRLAVVVGDVAGKGIPAALLMAKLSSEARSSFLSQADPAAAMDMLNQAVYRYTGRLERFVTLAVAVLDITTHTLTVVNAGHPAPLIYRRATGNLEEATRDDLIGLPLGVDRTFGYRSRQVHLQPGDCALLYSDGVTDQPDNRNQPVQQRAIRTPFQEGIRAPQVAGKRIVRILKRHVSSQGQYDDITLVCFGRAED